MRNIFEDSEGAMWAGSRAGLFRLASERWQREAPEISGAVIRAHVGPSGSLLIATDAGLFRRGRSDPYFRRIEAAPRIASPSLSEDVFGHLWTPEAFVGFTRVGGGTAASLPRRRGKGCTLLTDRRGHLWVGTFGQGLWRARIDREGRVLALEQATDLNGLSNNVVCSILEDRDRNIWVGTGDGLNRLTPHRVRHVLRVSCGLA